MRSPVVNENGTPPFGERPRSGGRATNTIGKAENPRLHIFGMPCAMIELATEDEIKLSELRFPRNGTMAVMVVHVGGLISSTLFEKAFRKWTPDEIERLHPNPERPGIAHHHDICVISGYCGIMPNQVISWL